MSAEAAVASPVATPSSDRRSRRLQRLAAALAIASLAEAFGIILVGSSGEPQFHLEANLITVGFLSTILLFPMMGALIIQRRPFTRVAWLMIALGLGLGFGILTAGYGLGGQPPTPTYSGKALPFAMAVLVLSQFFFVPTFVSITAFILFVAVTNQSSDAAIVGATLVVATLYAPLRKRLEAIVDKRFKFEHARFGAYRDELTRLLSVTDPERAAARLVHEATLELGVVGAPVLDARGDTVATAGTWPVEPVALVPIPNGGATLNSLALGPRPNGEPPDAPALALLEEIAVLAADAAARGERPRR